MNAKKDQIKEHRHICQKEKMPKGGKVLLFFSLIKGDHVVPMPGQKSVDKIEFMDEKIY